MHYYSALYESYPFAKSAIQSLLTLALELKCISESEAKNILEATLHLRKQLGKIVDPLLKGRRARLDMEMSEREAETAASLANRLQALSVSEFFVYDQFSEGVVYGMKA